MGRLFGTDGVRGEANRYPMNAEIAFALGQAVVYILKKEHGRPRIMIGKDTRISGYMLESSLESGITSMGGYPYLLSVLPTPGIAFIAQSMRAAAGIVISASHNPYQDNGIKIFSGSGFKLSDEQEETIEDLMLSNTLHTLVPPVKDMGQAFRMEDVNGRYIVFLKNTFPRDLSIEGMKIVLDTANGATYKVAPDTFWELGANIDVIHNSPNGININDKCGSQHTEDLRKRVVEKGAAIGLAFDGDGDRLIAVDEKGQEITGDQILLICAKMLKDQGKLKNNLLVATVMSNLGLRVACKRYGFKYHASKVGDRYVLEDMIRLGSIIGGEQSGHMVFLDHHTTGDGIVTAMQLLAAMVKTGKPLSELAKMMDIYPQKLINVDVKSKPDINTVPKVMKIIDKVERELKDEGRVLVRYSGTQNMCRVMVEGPSDSVTEKYCEEIADVVKNVLG
ncbi:MAG TPA: phosphoglucosamine mutase [Syntrophorhabdus sp.]|jgi:phosphoglucosamine mutase|nr:phosphoglucosamine mutase [Syntrophorhabdus sp.]MDI9558061.1 phosphoglucosamine mutase [Pseudomonadota bacterium]OPX93024.1 MAG: Phosphoglucosamine mutase [Syntrophorhabdus sp. PtaB.Bin027]OQB77535.1 MAG: Phosphoglucosamine mutase [Deltaproteobacteria bacterium ADurb.Bin135]HNQ46798.1 phosphoglucosamine mutase [Syntrophorhabdus sp.]